MPRRDPDSLNNYQPEYAAYESEPSAESPVSDSPSILIKNTEEDFINKKWRPMMAWSYMAICIADFILFPILFSVLQAVSGGSVAEQWAPITLEGAGLIHVAFGTILGITAYGRTKEKLDNKNN